MIYTHLGPAVNSRPQTQSYESVDGGGQPGVFQVIIEHAGRAWVSHEVYIPRLHPIRGEPPVPLCAALQEDGIIDVKLD